MNIVSASAGAAANRRFDPDRIIELRDAGRTYDQICDELDVSVQTVWRVLRRAGRVRVRETAGGD